MKKATLLFLLIGVCFSSDIFAQQGVIKNVSGTVELKSSGSSSFVPANSGDLVKEDTVISTGFKSNALIEVGSTLIAVRPLTRLSLAEIRSGSGTETLSVNLQAGRVRVDLKPPREQRLPCRLQVPLPPPLCTARVLSLTPENSPFLKEKWRTSAARA